MTYIAVTTRGIEDVCAEELGGKKVAPGRVAFKNWKEEVKSADLIFEFIKKEKISSLDDIRECCEKIELPKEKKCAVRCSREGNHQFRSVDVEKEIGSLLREKGYVLDRENAEQIIYIDIVEKICFIGLLKKEKLCRRGYRVKIHNQGISGCLAYALLKIAKYNPETEIMLDPLCKDGTIAIEAALLGGKKVYASDPVKNTIRNARINAQMAKVNLDIRCLELSQLKTGKEKSVDLLATRIILARENNKSLNVWKECMELAEKIAKKTIMVTNTEDGEKNIPKEMELQEKRKIQRGGATEYIYVFVKKER